MYWRCRSLIFLENCTPPEQSIKPHLSVHYIGDSDGMGVLVEQGRTEDAFFKWVSSCNITNSVSLSLHLYVNCELTKNLTNTIGYLCKPQLQWPICWKRVWGPGSSDTAGGVQSKRVLQLIACATWLLSLNFSLCQKHDIYFYFFSSCGTRPSSRYGWQGYYAWNAAQL